MLPSRLRSLLVVAHPGHELRVCHWVEMARPDVALFTDGSGGAASDRRHGSEALLSILGAQTLQPFGLAPDRHFYAALRAGDLAFFGALLRHLERALEGRERVVSDAPEGYNPVHDLCHALTALAVEKARARGEAIEHLCFPLDGPPEKGGAGGLRLYLDAEALARKLAAAKGFPGLEEEFGAAVAKYGAEAYAVEVLSPAPGPLETWYEGKPFYETYGERMVAEGRYTDVLRRDLHVQPLLEQLVASQVWA